MKKISFHNGVLIYYGNPAGYLQDGKVILDSLFYKEELVRWLKEKEQAEVEIREGVYDRLAAGGGMETAGPPKEGKEVYAARSIRIYQLKQGSPIMMRFISLAERKKRGFGYPQRSEYALVYEGEVEKFDLEEVWEKFGRRLPAEFMRGEDFKGHALSISDVVELAEEDDSRFFYVEPSGFEEIMFPSQE